MSEWTPELRSRLEHLSLRPEREAEIVEELSQHLDDFVRERMLGGVSREQARHDALADLDERGVLERRLGEIERRPSLTLPPPGAPARGLWLTQLWQDVRLTLRAMRQRPGFVMAVITTLALTIGPATAIVSVGNWLLWTPSRAVSDPDGLVVMWTGRWREGGGVSPSGVSYLNLDEMRAASTTLSSLAGWQESMAGIAVPGSKARTAQVGYVTGNFFDVLGVRLAAGRAFTAQDDQYPFGQPVCVISHALGTSAFGSADGALGKTVHVNGRALTIVGVAPVSFGGASPSSQVAVWFTGATYSYVNRATEESVRRFQARTDGLFYSFIGRLAAGRSAADAQAELDALVPALADNHPADNSKFKAVRARVFPGLGPPELMRTTLARQVNGLLIVAAALLVLGCANVTNLLIADGTRARREHALRLALGASRARLFRQQLTQSVVLSIAGAGLGVGLAIAIKQLIQVGVMPGLSTTPDPPVVAIDRLVLAVTSAVAVVCGVAAGITPAWLAMRTNVGAGLGASATRSVTGVPYLRVTLASLQLALSLALVTGAALLAVTLQRMSRVETGFQPEGVVVQWVSLRGYGYNANAVHQYNQQLVERLRAQPGVEDASLATGHPFGYSRITRLVKPGGDGTQTIDGRMVATDGRFPEVLGLTMQQGRYFEPPELFKDARTPGDPIVLSATLARQIFGREDVVGQQVTLARTLDNPATALTVVGVMKDTLTSSLTAAPDPVMFVPLMRADLATQSVVLLRTRAGVRQVNEMVSSAATEIDPTLPQGPARSLVDWIGRGYASTTLFAQVVGSVSLVALTLAAVGLYGLLAQLVGDRRREFGIRLAVGATARDVVRLVTRQAVVICGIGIVLGTALTYWGVGLLKAYLWGVSPFDPAVYAVAATVLVMVVGLATARPAWSATRVNPIETLRVE